MAPEPKHADLDRLGASRAWYTAPLHTWPALLNSCALSRGAAVTQLRVLIVKPSSLGDIVHALPAASLLRAALPDAHLTWFVFRAYETLLASHPAIDQVWAVDRPRIAGGWRPRHWRALAASLASLAGGGFDAVLDLQGLARSAMVSAATGAPLRIGFDDAREGAQAAYTHRVVAGGPSQHAVSRYLDAAEHAVRIIAPQGAATTPADRATPAHAAKELGRSVDDPRVARYGFHLEPTAEAAAAVDAALARWRGERAPEGAPERAPAGAAETDLSVASSTDPRTRPRRLVTFAPCDRRGTKSLPPARASELVAKLTLSGHPAGDPSGANDAQPRRDIPADVAAGEYAQAEVVVLATPSERALARAIVEGVPAYARGRVLNLAGETSLASLVAWLARADLHIGADSAPMHLAAALGTPCVAIFGPTAPQRYRPLGAPASIVRGTCIEDAMPCYRRYCAHLSCMNTLSLDDLVDNARALTMAESPTEPRQR